MSQEKRAAIYARTATLKLIGDPRGIQSQAEACIRYCEQHGYIVNPALIKQEITGGIGYKDREGLTALLEAAKHGEFDILVVTGFDRLSRRHEYLAEIIHKLEACDVSLACVDQILDGIAVKLFLTGRADEIIRMQHKSRLN